MVRKEKRKGSEKYGKKWKKDCRGGGLWEEIEVKKYGKKGEKEWK